MELGGQIGWTSNPYPLFANGRDRVAITIRVEGVTALAVADVHMHHRCACIEDGIGAIGEFGR